MTRDQFISAVRSLIGTLYRHQGRSRAAGVDCVGLPLAAAEECGTTGFQDIQTYSPHPDGKTLEDTLAINAKRVMDEDDLQPGDLLLFAIGRHPQHVGVYVGDGRMVHAYQSVGRVVEHGFVDPWKKRLVGVYRPPFEPIAEVSK